MSSSTSNKQGQTPAKSGRGRKPANKPAPEKKQPQRGLGVAQLERLRLQERWRKMTEMPSPDDGDINNVMTQPLESVPVQYGAGNHNILFPNGAGFGSGAVDLTSPRNALHYNYLDHINKKKRLISGEIMNNTYGVPQSDHQILQMGIPGINNTNNNTPNHYYLINNQNNNTNSNNTSVGDHLSLGFSGTITHSKSLPSDLNVVQSLDLHRQGVEIRAFQRRGNDKNINNNNIQSNVVMEYEFFPGLNDSVLLDRRRHHQEVSSASSSSSLSNYYNTLGSSQPGTTTSPSPSTNLDLSLKL